MKIIHFQLRDNKRKQSNQIIHAKGTKLTYISILLGESVDRRQRVGFHSVNEKNNKQKELFY